MAIASIRVICKDCGEEFEWRRECHNRKEANDTEEWAKNTIDQCPRCYAKQQKELERAKQKEESEKYAAVLSDYNLPVLQGTEKQVEWANIIRNMSVGEMLRYKPKESFWTFVRNKTDAIWWIENRDDVDYLQGFQKLINKERDMEEAQKRISMLDKPVAPKIIAGHKWNYKIYGREGNYSIYPDGEKVMLSDEQASELKQYVKAKEEYKAKVEKIKKDVLDSRKGKKQS